MDHDVIIVGGGIAGASLGAQIAAKRRTLLVEAEPQCGYHATGRSAAFWLASYGGPRVEPLTRASRALLDSPPPDFSERGFLRQRGAIHLARAPCAELDAIAATVATRPLDSAELARLIPGLRAEWSCALLEADCADIDVAALHAAYLRHFRRSAGELRTGARLERARYRGGRWQVELEGGGSVTAALLVNAAGAWADQVAIAAGVPPIGIAPRRRTMVQLRVERGTLRDLPLVADAQGQYYFKGEGERTIWLSPHDEIDSPPTDAQPEEIDVATAIDRFERVVDWRIEAVERRWAGLRSFAPDRLPVYGFDPSSRAFFWCAGQGGFGIQTAPAAARLAAALLLGEPPDPMVAAIDPAPYSPARLASRG